jgi:hypothetical protein
MLGIVDDESKSGGRMNKNDINLVSKSSDIQSFLPFFSDLSAITIEGKELSSASTTILLSIDECEHAGYISKSTGNYTTVKLKKESGDMENYTPAVMSMSSSSFKCNCQLIHFSISNQVNLTNRT